MLKLPTPRPRQIFPTGMMKLACERTLTHHYNHPIVVWTGPSRVGKSTTARYFRDDLNEQHGRKVAHSFRAFHYELGRSAYYRDARDEKRAIKSLYEAVVSPLDHGTYLRSQSESLAQMLIQALTDREIQCLLVDEAGHLTPQAVNGMVLIRNTAENMGWPLSIVLIGMNDLPSNVTREPQNAGRVAEWIVFEPIKMLMETRGLLEVMHPFFSTLSEEDPSHAGIVEWIHQEFEGVPGRIKNFVDRFARYYNDGSRNVDLAFLMGIQRNFLRNHARAQELREANYGHRPEAATEKGLKATANTTPSGEGKDGGEKNPTRQTGGRNDRKKGGVKDAA
jgi:hypothetical protein